MSSTTRDILISHSGAARPRNPNTGGRVFEFLFENEYPLPISAHNQIFKMALRLENMVGDIFGGRPAKLQT